MYLQIARRRRTSNCKNGCPTFFHMIFRQVSAPSDAVPLFYVLGQPAVSVKLKCCTQTLKKSWLCCHIRNSAWTSQNNGNMAQNFSPFSPPNRWKASRLRAMGWHPSQPNFHISLIMVRCTIMSKMVGTKKRKAKTIIKNKTGCPAHYKVLRNAAMPPIQHSTLKPQYNEVVSSSR